VLTAILPFIDRRPAKLYRQEGKIQSLKRRYKGSLPRSAATSIGFFTPLSPENMLHATEKLRIWVRTSVQRY
jgi:hypothetical protein